MTVCDILSFIKTDTTEKFSNFYFILLILLKKIILRNGMDCKNVDNGGILQFLIKIK